MALGDRNIDPREEWQNRLFKLLPAEFTGLFLAGRSLVDPNSIGDDKNLFILFGILLLLLPFYNALFLGIQRHFKQNLIICVSFLIWCLNIDLFRLQRGPISNYLLSIDLKFWAPMSMGIWLVIILPLVFRKQSWEDQFFAQKLALERQNDPPPSAGASG